MFYPIFLHFNDLFLRHFRSGKSRDNTTDKFIFGNIYSKKIFITKYRFIFGNKLEQHIVLIDRFINVFIHKLLIYK